MLKQLKTWLVIPRGSWASFALDIQSEAEEREAGEGIAYDIHALSPNFTFVFHLQSIFFPLATFSRHRSGQFMEN